MRRAKRIPVLMLFLATLRWTASAQESPLSYAPPSSSERARLIQAATELAIQYTSNLPNFICTQTTRRLELPKGSKTWKARDTLVSEVVFSEKDESPNLLTINGKATRKTLDDMGGFTNTGDFGRTLQWIFSPKSETKFQWESWTNLRGRPAHIFSYRIEQAHSEYHLGFNLGSDNRGDGVFGFRGLVYVDAATYRVMRLTHVAEGVPAEWPFSAGPGELDYGFVDLDGQQVLLPVHGEALLVYRDGKQARNVMEFSKYRKFSTETTIRFERP